MPSMTLSGTVITVIISTIVILTLTALMVIISAVIILHFRKKMQKITGSKVYEAMAPMQTLEPCVEPMEIEENVSNATNIPKDNVIAI